MTSHEPKDMWASGASYDAVVSGLVLNFFPQPSQALSEMIRAVRMGGTVAAYVWDYAGQMQLMRYFWDAANKVMLVN
jgi:ubiquinone/menaquinone biosynthesis C-methylase UbiE